MYKQASTTVSLPNEWSLPGRIVSAALEIYSPPRGGGDIGNAAPDGILRGARFRQLLSLLSGGPCHAVVAPVFSHRHNEHGPRGGGAANHSREQRTQDAPYGDRPDRGRRQGRDALPRGPAVRSVWSYPERRRRL